MKLYSLKVKLLRLLADTLLPLVIAEAFIFQTNNGYLNKWHSRILHRIIILSFEQSARLLQRLLDKTKKD